MGGRNLDVQPQTQLREGGMISPLGDRFRQSQGRYEGRMIELVGSRMEEVALARVINTYVQLSGKEAWPRKRGQC